MIDLSPSPTASEAVFQKFLLHLVRQMALAIVVLLAVSLIIFIASRADGDPRWLMLDEDATEQEFFRMGEELGLDEPIVQQYFIFIGNALSLDFGDSIREIRPVRDIILDQQSSTIYLAQAVLPVSLVVGIFFGWVASQIRGRESEILFRAVNGFIESMPSFWLGLLLILIFAVKLDLFPTDGRGGGQSFILPVLTLSPLFAVAFARLTRSILLPETAAGGKGLSSKRVFPAPGSTSVFCSSPG